MSPARKRFQELIRQRGPQLALAEAAQCIAWEDQGAGAPEEVLRQLDGIAAAAQPRLAGRREPQQVVEALNDYLFGELGFRGNSVGYSEPANSFLDRVLATRTGLPITLSVVYMEVGWRLGLPVSGVALPGHFLARYTAPDREFYIDPFQRGLLWSRGACEERIAAAYGSITPTLAAQVMAPPSRPAILVRMLRNLKHSYLERAEPALALTAVERLLLVTPHDWHELRDRGLLHARLGAIYQALEDLDRYAREAPEATDLHEIQEYARALAATRVGWN
jgi:regulator of sirC expression with transglutaminase-like and TPR domain